MNTKYTYKNLKENFSKQTLMKLLLEEKFTFRDLQRKYHYNERLWSKLAKEYDIDKPKYHQHYMKELPMNEIIDLYVNHKQSARAIAKKYGVTHGCIIKRLRECNIDIRNFCDSAYYNNRNTGKLTKPYVDNTGYLRRGDMRLHREIMQEILGRELQSDEIVHHLDGNKLNNNPTNLIVFPDSRSHLLYHTQKWTDNPYKFIEHYNNVLIQTVFNNEWLYHQYIDLNKSIAQISRETGVSRPTVKKQLQIFNIFGMRECSINQYN